MDPQPERTPGLALPKPSPEQGMYNAAPQQGGAGSHEAMLPHLESSPMPTMAPPIVPPQMPMSAAQPVSVAPAAPVANPLTATAAPLDDNTDALDEEWISKAKAIVEQTKHDPHLESRELSKVKADYLRIRYNKHIKVAEEQSK